MSAGTIGGPADPFHANHECGFADFSAGPLTQKGMIVGTFQYMAPEVLQGAEADARSDIFSFGCALYEMTAGSVPFEGNRRSEFAGGDSGKRPGTRSAPRTP